MFYGLNERYRITVVFHIVYRYTLLYKVLGHKNCIKKIDQNSARISHNNEKIEQNSTRKTWYNLKFEQSSNRTNAY